MWLLGCLRASSGLPWLPAPEVGWDCFRDNRSSWLQSQKSSRNPRFQWRPQNFQISASEQTGIGDIIKSIAAPSITTVSIMDFQYNDTEHIRTQHKNHYHYVEWPIFTLLCWVPWHQTGNTNWRGRISTVDLLVLTCLGQLLLKSKTSFTFLQTSYPNEEVNCIEPSSSVSIPSIKYAAECQQTNKNSCILS